MTIKVAASRTTLSRGEARPELVEGDAGGLAVVQSSGANEVDFMRKLEEAVPSTYSVRLVNVDFRPA